MPSENVPKPFKMGPVVSNSSPLIALEQIGQLSLLSRLFGSVLIPPAVVRETAPTITLPTWIVQQIPAQLIGPRILRITLGQGESEAISLALEIQASWIILDDRPARRTAEALGLSIMGTLGVLLAAKRHGFLANIRPSIEALIRFGFHVGADLYKRVLTDAGEALEAEI